MGAFNQEKALVGAFSVIVKTDCETDGSFYSTKKDINQQLVRQNCKHFPFHAQDNKSGDYNLI